MASGAPVAQRRSLRAFLCLARSTLEQHHLNRSPEHLFSSPHKRASRSPSNPARKLTLVLGNESADLDSITSAIIYAYLATYTHNTDLGNIHIPVLNIPRRDVRIRPELLRLLPHAGLDTENLITLDDVFPSSSTSNESVQPRDVDLVLTDHNKPVGPFSSLGASLVGCIDHHVDEGTVPLGKEPRIISSEAGSCTSLVVDYFHSSWSPLSNPVTTSAPADAEVNTALGAVGAVGASERLEWDVQIAKFALASILIDTNNLQDESKTGKVDQQTAAYLKAKIQLAPLSCKGDTFNSDSFFESIREAKTDLEGLSMDEVLRKDYKEWTVESENSDDTGYKIRLGISSVVKPLEWLATNSKQNFSNSRAPVVDALFEYMTSRDLDVLAVMTAATHGAQRQFRRELLAMIRAPSAGNFINEWERQASKALDLRKHNSLEGLERSPQEGKISDNLTVRAWWQQNLSRSRKQVAPLMRDVLQHIRTSEN